MKAQTKKIIYALVSLLLCAGILFFLIPKNNSNTTAREIEESKFVILKIIEDRFTGNNVFVAVDGSDRGCDKLKDNEPCYYFFEYRYPDWKPTVVGTYRTGPDHLFIPSLKFFRDSDTILLKTGQDFITREPGDHHSIEFTKELNIRTGNIITTTSTESYVPYESMP